MKLKKLILQGFKSFADRTTLEFHEGITCIVGPNGCGKSNIGDAIRWVLGEQSAKSLRGGKMPDVIFAGTTTRKAVNLSEVTIVFSNAEEALNLPYHEVAVTRKLYRSGESEYLINQEVVRLKDIQNLFLGTGVGKNNFSIFEQGKIDQIIQLSPEERRFIFDEAAGIVRFLQQKKDALKKIEETSLNLSRVTDIQGEVTRQIAILKSQAESALLYKDAESQLESLEKGILVSKYSGSFKKQEELLNKKRIAENQKKELLVKNGHFEEEAKEARAVINHLETLLQRSREARLMKQGEKDHKAEMKKEAFQREEESKTRHSKIKDEIEELQNIRKKWGKEIELLKKEKEEATLSLDQQKIRTKAAESVFLVLEKKLQTVRTKQTESQKERFKLMEKANFHESESKQLKVRVEAALEKKSHLEVRLETLKSYKIEKEEEVKQKKKDHFALTQEVTKAKEVFDKAEVELKGVDLDLGEKEKGLFNKNSEIQKIEAKRQALIHLRDNFSGFSKGGKRLLQLSSDRKNPLYGLLKGLFEYIIVEKGKEAPVNAVLKGYSETLVVETKRDLEETLKAAKSEGLTDFSILCLEKLPKKSLSASWSVEPNILSAHLLHDVSLIEDRGSSKLGLSSYAEEGCFVDAKGVLFFGNPKEETIFSREAEIKALEVSLEELKVQKETLEESVAKLKARKKEIQDLRFSLDLELRKLEMKSVEVNFQLQRALSEKEKLYKEESDVLQEIEGHVLIVKGLKEREAALFEEHKIALSLVEKAVSEVQALEDSLESETKEWMVSRETFKSEEKVLNQIEERFSEVKHKLHLLEVKDEETEKHILRLQNEFGRLKEVLQELFSKKERGSFEIQDLEKELKELNEKEAHNEKLLAERKKEFQEVFNKKGKIEQEIKKEEAHLQDSDIKLANLEGMMTSLLEEGLQRFSLDLASCDLKEFILEVSLEKAEKQVKELKVFLEKNANVNLSAIDLCKEEEARLSFINTQVDDLTKAKEELLKMIEGLDGESRTLFKKTFDEIRENFKKNFQILFRGGEADLELLEGKDILECGIEITAKPPGKQMRSLSLLSGGEKCLTAMALLFAIFEVKSSPFCVLDEIDAPLDDSNVERFLNVVRAFVDKSQFIIVTHNKRTMALGDRLYGVSMQEKGVSKILSMEFAKEGEHQLALV